MYNIVDLFCGTGAISYGIKKCSNKFNVIGGIDLDRSACKTAQKNHPEGRFVCKSIDEISPSDFDKILGKKSVNVIVGGPPCQGFSSLRPSRGLAIEDDRNRLYKHFIKYVEYFKPEVFLMENVVGLLGSNNGLLINEIEEGFKVIGYKIEWRIVNAANFGVPQKRERLIMLGVNILKVKTPNLIFPSPTHHFEGKVIGTKRKEKYIVSNGSEMRALSVMDAISDLPDVESGEELCIYKSAPKNDYQESRRKNQKKLTLHIAAKHNAKMLNVMKHSGNNKSSIPEGLITSGYSSSYSRLSPNEPSTTITVKFTSPASSKCIHPFQNRAITPREAARVQSFDDEFIFCGSKTEISSQIGNAVPPLLGRALAPMILSNLEINSFE